MRARCAKATVPLDLHKPLDRPTPKAHERCARVQVMLPLDLHKWRISSLEKRLWKLKDAGVHGVMCDIWWGLVEKKPKEYEFATYTELANLCQKVVPEPPAWFLLLGARSRIRGTSLPDTSSSRHRAMPLLKGIEHRAMPFPDLEPLPLMAARKVVWGAISGDSDARDLHCRLALSASLSCRSTSAEATLVTLAAFRSPSGCKSAPTSSGATLHTTRTSAGVTSALHPKFHAPCTLPQGQARG